MIGLAYVRGNPYVCYVINHQYLSSMKDLIVNHLIESDLSIAKSFWKCDDGELKTSSIDHMYLDCHFLMNWRAVKETVDYLQSITDEKDLRDEIETIVDFLLTK